jgi:hypothetical protein
MKLLLLSIMAFVPFLSQCIGFDMAMMETAMPLRLGRFGVQGTSNVSGNLVDSEATEETGTLKRVEEDFFFTVKAKIGLPFNSELGYVRIMNNEQAGGKVFFKKGLAFSEDRITSIMPAFTYMTIRSKASASTGRGNSFSPEVSLLRTNVVNDYLSYTIGARAAINYIDHKDLENSTGNKSFISPQIGARVNLRLGFNKIYVMEEIGADWFPSTVYGQKYLISGSLGVGWN